jgi:MFS family permease
MAATTGPGGLRRDWRLGRDSSAFMIAGFGAASLIANVSFLMIYPLYGTFGTVFHVTRTTQDLLALTALLIGGATSGIITAWGSTFGFRNIAYACMLSVAAGCFIMAAAPSFTILLIGNCFLGAGLAAVPLAGAGIRTYVPPSRLGRSMGVVGILTGLSVLIGFPLFGLVEDLAHVSYTTVLYAFGVIALLGAAFAYVTIPNNTAIRREGGKDYFGAILFTAGIVAIILPLAEGNSWGWGSPWVIGLLIGGVALTAVWVWYENRIEHPLVQLRSLRKPAVLYGILLFLWTAVAVEVINLTGPQFVETPRAAGYGFGANVLGGGLAMIPFAVGLIIAGWLSGRLIDRIGANAVAFWCFAVCGVATALLALLHSQAWEVYLLMGIYGLGFDAGYAVSYYVIHREIEHEDSGGAVSLAFTAARIGSGIAIALVTILLSGSSVSVHGVPFPTRAGYEDSWWLMTGASVAGFLTVAFFARRGSRGTGPQTAAGSLSQAAGPEILGTGLAPGERGSASA